MIKLFIALSLVCWSVALGSETFEVAVLRPSEPLSLETARLEIDRLTKASSPGRFERNYMSVMSMVTLAYGVVPDQVSGPEWMKSVYYSISAKLPEGASQGDVPGMLLALLNERFQLRAHRASRQSDAIALLPRGESPLVPVTNQEPQHATSLKDGTVHDVFVGDMGGLARLLSGRIGIPVADLTNRQGTYRIEFDYQVPKYKPGADKWSLQEDQRRLYDDVMRPFGLTVARRRVATESVIVDSIERTPTPN